MSLDRIDQFELSNKLAVNVYEVENNERVVPLRASVITNPRDTIDLLFVEQGEKKHYCLIRDLPKLLKHASDNKTFVKLPKKIEDKKACVNIQCNDGKSFKWCILSAKYGKTWSIAIVWITTLPILPSLKTINIQWSHTTFVYLNARNE